MSGDQRVAEVGEIAESAPREDARWTALCRLEELTPERGAAALLDDEAVALFRLPDGTVHCLGHRDPFSGANVLARGIVGTRTVDGEQVPVVSSPMHKQPFDLRTGGCLDDPSVTVPTWPVRVVDGWVEVGSG